MEAMKKRILELHEELKSNNGIVPDSWKPWIKILLIILPIVACFGGSELKIIITEIITAIEAFDNI